MDGVNWLRGDPLPEELEAVLAAMDNNLPYAATVLTDHSAAQLRDFAHTLEELTDRLTEWAKERN